MDFGILSTANIGRAAVVPAIRDSDHRVLAAASRDATRAEAFADEFDVPRSYGSYEELLDDDDLDAVYNPLPNALHAEWTKRAADAGLDVLCEKPLAVDADEAAEMRDYCAERGVMLAEAFMYYYHPRTRRALEIVEEELGSVRRVSASFEFPLRGRPDDVRLNPDLAGGSLMDVGCYAVTAARQILGEPEWAFAHAADARDCGVDTHFTGVLGYGDGVVAEVTSSFDVPEVQRYRVEAEDGWLEVDDAFAARSDEASLAYSVDGRTVTESFDPVDQYRLEVERFAECVASGATPLTDGDEAVRTMRVIDALYESADRGVRVALDS